MDIGVINLGTSSLSEGTIILGAGQSATIEGNKITITQLANGVKLSSDDGDTATVLNGSAAHVKTVTVSANDPEGDGYDHVYFLAWEGDATKTDAEVILNGVDLMANVNRILSALNEIVG